MTTKAPWEVLGEEFVKAYYATFDSNREQLVCLYAVSITRYLSGITV